MKSVCTVNKTVEYLLSVIEGRLESFYEKASSQIPGTEKQREREIWINRRWSLITASDSKDVFNLRLIVKQMADSTVQIWNYLKRKLWERNSIITYDMLYGI